MAERERDDGLQLQAHHSVWSTWSFGGDPAKTREHADAGRLLYDPEKHASMADMIRASAPESIALTPNGCSDIPRRRSQASLMLWRWRSGSPTRSR